MLKLLCTLLLSFVASSAYAQVNIQSRESLQIIFGGDYEDVNKVSDNDFGLYSRWFEFTLNNIENLGSIGWDNPGSKTSGKITIISRIQENGTVCKSFTQLFTVKGQRYQGDGVGCVVNGQWVIKKI